MKIKAEGFSALNLVTLFFLIGFTLPFNSYSADLEKINKWFKDTKHNQATINVSSFYGDYNIENKVSGLPAPSLIGPKNESWMPSTNKSPKNYNIAVIFPHLKDPYWVAVNYGIVTQARRVGVNMSLKHPGGYRNLGKQVTQMKEVLASGKYDGLIIGAVQYQKSKLEDTYKQFHDAGIPIISVVNDSYTPTINAKSLVSWQKLGAQVGTFLAEHSNNKKIRVAIMPGPKGTGWAPDSLKGFMQKLTELNLNDKVEVVDVLWGDTGDKAQRHQGNFLLKSNKNIDYVIGNAIAINAMSTRGKNNEPAAKDLYKESHPNLQLISTYITQDVYDLIQEGKVLASAADLMKEQGIIAMDMMVRLLNGEKPGVDMPFRVGPSVPIIHQKNINDWKYERLFGPRDYEAIINYQAK